MSWLCKWFGIGCPKPTPVPPTPVPPIPPAPTEHTVAVIVTGVNGPIANAKIVLDGAGPYTPTNQDGYTTMQVATSLVESHLWVEAAGYKKYDVHITLPAHNVDLLVGGTSTNPNQIVLPALVTSVAPFATPDERDFILTNFCNLTDSKGRIEFAPMIASLSEDEQTEWITDQVKNGSTHMVLSPYAGYDAINIPSFNWYDQPQKFAALVRKVLATPGANGKGITPILILDSGESGFKGRITKYWPPLIDAIRDILDHVIVVPGWELITASEVTSAEMSFALKFLNNECRVPNIWAHLSPRRAAMSSNPVEADDPWQGAESGCWKSHGGEFVKGLLYQSEAVRFGDEGCDAVDDSCWLNRWEDVVPRIGNGMNGWRIMKLAYFEGPAYYYCRNQADSAFAIKIAERAKALADKYNVRCGFGNGIPSSLKK